MDLEVPVAEVEPVVVAESEPVPVAEESAEEAVLLTAMVKY